MKNNITSCIRVLTLLSSIIVVTDVLAQTPPDAGQLLREAETQRPLESDVIPEMPAKLAPPEKEDGVSLPVEHFQFNGFSVLKEQELQQAVLPWIGKKLTLPELKYITDLVAELYREKGYLVRAYLPEQNIDDGSVSIEIIEARFGEVKVDSELELLSKNPNLIKGMAGRGQVSGELLNLSAIERASLLINDLPGVSAKAVLVAGEKENHTDVKLSLKQGDRQSSYVSVDNYGSRSSGKNRLIYSTIVASPFDRGDQLFGNGMLSDGNLYLRLGYDYPVGLNGMRIGASLSFLSYKLGGEFDDLDAKGSASNLTLTASYPLIRQVRKNLRLSGNLLYRGYENEQLGINTSDKTVTALNVGVSGDHLDAYYGGGMLYFGSSLTLGNLDLSANQTNLLLDQSSSRTDGSYVKLDWNVARLQRINLATNFWLSAKGQFVNKNVDSSESISLGGISGVRAYPNLEISGDEGLLLTAELRYRIYSNWELKVFYDHGVASQKATVSEASQRYTLKGYGLGVGWNMPKEKITARFTLAHRLGENPLADAVTGDDSDGSLDLYPVWLSVAKYF